jgi:3-hydroxybutyryl-CoA dehydratase
MTAVNSRATSPLDLAPGSELTSAVHAVTEEDVLRFADLTGDHNPVHTDIDWARRSLFGGRIAHGLLVVAWAVGLFPFDHDRPVVLRAVEATFKRPVRLGDTVRLHSRVLDNAILGPDWRQVRFRWLIRNQRDQVVIRLGVEALVHREAGASCVVSDSDEVERVRGVLPL